MKELRKSLEDVLHHESKLHTSLYDVLRDAKFYKVMCLGTEAYKCSVLDDTYTLVFHQVDDCYVQCIVHVRDTEIALSPEVSFDWRKSIRLYGDLSN